ncbi:MAG: hybrid sensor histidine kinase/response regulator [Deltaproteobacteria bacterium]|nr:hybrid sensor histidine kinase/response regulator [Deltaproteobacteria bacterium]
MTIDYHAYPILFVDDEQQNLVAFEYAMEEQFSVLTASCGEDAIRILREREIAVIIADQRMPGMSGSELCAKALEIQPQAVRIIVTAYADLHAAIEAINKGQVLRYIAKPWKNEELVQILRTSIELVHLQRTVQDMEIRLLKAGQSAVAMTVHQEFAHEFNNPLASLNANADVVADYLALALQSLYDPEKLRRYLNEAQEAHTDSITAISQLRALVSRLREGRTSSIAPPTATCDAARVIDSTVRIIRREIERVARLRTVVEASPNVTIDASALGQIVLNLLLNAAQALKTSSQTEKTITIRVTEEREEAKIVISDTGPGIPPENIGRIFDPYFTTKKKSTGIGLAVAQELAKQAGGRVSVESPPGQGATFVISLPLAGT